MLCLLFLCLFFHRHHGYLLLWCVELRVPYLTRQIVFVSLFFEFHCNNCLRTESTLVLLLAVAVLLLDCYCTAQPCGYRAVAYIAV